MMYNSEDAESSDRNSRERMNDRQNMVILLQPQGDMMSDHQE